MSCSYRGKTLIYVPRIALLVAVLSFSAVILLPETLASKILSLRVAKMNAEARSIKFVARGQLERGNTWQFLVSLVQFLLFDYVSEGYWISKLIRQENNTLPTFAAALQ